MITEMNAVRRWAVQRNAIPYPRTIEVAIQDQLASLRCASTVGQVDLPLLTPAGVAPQEQITLSQVEISNDWSAITVELEGDWHLPIDRVPLAPDDVLDFQQLRIVAVSDDDFVSLQEPDWILVKLEKLWFTAPAILDVFDALKNPGRTGKSYAPKSLAELSQPSLWADKPLARERCRHGLQKHLCTVCQAEAARSKPKPRTAKGAAARTVDVFDLLLPYLQPPIELLLAQPLLFPANRRPLDYQIQGIRFLAEQTSALLGDEMGLGKTIQAIVALQVLYRRGRARRTLILCPRSLLGTWQRELEKWAPELFVLRVRGNKVERMDLWQSPAAVYLTTYETLREDSQNFPSLSRHFDVVVLDEAQKIKNPESGVSRAVRRVNAEHRWALSGTPLENRLDDVSAIFGYLKPGLFRADEVLTPEMVKQRIAPFFLRRRTADVRKELPDKVRNEIWLELTDAQQRTYVEAETAGKAQLTQVGTTRVHVFALVSKLKQICNLDPITGESCKADYLVDQLDSIVENGQKALVFSHLPQISLAKIEPRLRSFYVSIFDGQLTDQRREQLVRDFQERDHPNVLLMSVQAGGTGLTLTAANHVFHFDHWWNPAVARQAEGRAHRIGQESTVFVYDLYTSGTIEQRIYELLQRKQALFDSVIDDLSAEYVQGAITDDELFGLFDLKPPIGQGGTALTGVQAGTMGLPKQDGEPSRTRKLHELTPLEFERYVAQLYERMGFRTELTNKSHDHGVDIIGRRLTPLGVEKIIVQCKHYPNGTVGEPVVRELIGAWQDHRDAKTAILVTSGRFSGDAVSMAQRHQVTLADRTDLERLQQMYSHPRSAVTRDPSR